MGITCTRFVQTGVWLIAAVPTTEASAAAKVRVNISRLLIESPTTRPFGIPLGPAGLPGRLTKEMVRLASLLMLAGAWPASAQQWTAVRLHPDTALYSQ